MTPVVDERFPENRYAIHKSTEFKTELFMLFPKSKGLVDLLYSNLSTFIEPSLRKTEDLKKKFPNISAERANYKNNENITYGKNGFISYRKGLYYYHTYQFVRNGYSKFEIASMYDPTQRTKKNVLNELLNIIQKATFGIPHESCTEHSI